jgi:flagellar biosynthesis protein FlhB
VRRVGKNEGKTEKPSKRKRRKARREGQTARSAEVPIALSLVGAVVLAKVFMPPAARSLAGGMRSILSTAGTAPTGALVRSVARTMVVSTLLPILAISVLLALAGGIQTGFMFAPATLKPKFSHLSLKKGMQRYKPATMVWEGLRSSIKLGLGALVVWGPIRVAVQRSTTLSGMNEWLRFTGTQATTMLVRLAALAAILAAADYTMVKRRTGKSLKMSKQETRQESKEEEGDPQVRAHRRRRHAEISRHNMIVETATADVVLMNPTHLAVALRYAANEPAPRVVAKGSGALALKLRATAYRHGVMVREDKPLARAIFSRCKVGHFVPAALFEAVAVVLAAAYRRRRKGSL